MASRRRRFANFSALNANSRRNFFLTSCAGEAGAKPKEGYMKKVIGVLAGFIAGVAAIGVSSASAERRPPYCPVVHDHRVHSANYYDYYPADDYYRAGDYRRDRDRYDRNRYDRSRYDRRDSRDRRYYDGRGQGSRVVFRDVIPTRGRASIVVVEEIYYGRRRDRRICTVTVRGPDGRYVPYERLRRVAKRRCSRRAEIRIR